MKYTFDIYDNAIKASRRGFVTIAAFSLFANLLMLAVPLYMLQIFDRVLTSRNVDTLIALTLIVAIALFALALLELARSFVMIRLADWLDGVLSGSLLLGNMQSHQSDDDPASEQPLRDLGAVKSFLTGPSIIPFMDAPWTPVFVAVIFLMNPLLGWIALGGTVAMILIAFITEVASRRVMVLAGRQSAISHRDASEAVRDAGAIAAMGMIAGVIARWRRRNDAASALQGQASRRVSAMTAFSRFVRFGLQVAILATGAWLVINHAVTPGVMIAGSILLGRALAPVEQGIGAWRAAQQARHAFRRLKLLLVRTQFLTTATRLPAPIGRLVVEDTSFVHRRARRAALQRISFQLQPGEALAIIGPSAAGKTTLARLLVGVRKPASGHVRLDGVDVAATSAESLRQHIGYLPQDVALMSATVRENIARMAEGDDGAVVAAARLAGVHETILSLPEGYETLIGEGGLALSGGERQRIALARAFYGDPRFIVLDEPGASLDQEGEAALMQAISTLRERRVTVVVITHHPGVLRHVDKVLIIRDGRMHGFGDASEVLAKIREIGSRVDRKIAARSASND